MHGTIYVATNTVDGKQYVGLTRRTVAARWSQHKTVARANAKTHLCRALRKYGGDKFVVQPYVSALSVGALADLEKQVIQDLCPQYNQTCGGEVTLGRKYDDATKERIRVSNTGKKRTAEQKLLSSEIQKQRMADRPELRAANAAHLLAERQKPGVEEKRIAAARAAQLGRVWADESRAKLSAACMGRKYGPEIIERMKESKRRAIYCATNGITYACRVTAAAATGVSPRTVWRICNKHGVSRQTFAFCYA